MIKTFHVIKSETSRRILLCKENLAKILYINRDIRDIAVAAKFKWGLTGSDLIVMLDRAQSSYQDMIENKAFENDWCLHQKYENVFRNNYLAIKQMQSFSRLNQLKK